MSARCQQGLSLVELMVGIALGLMVVAAAATLLVHQLNDTRRLRLETQLEQDLRAAADLVARDLRRAGYWPAAAFGSIDNPYAEVSAGDAAHPGTSIGYARALDADDSLSGRERSGVKLENGSLKLLLGDAGWQALTDPDVVTVTSFRVALTTHTLPLDAACDQPCPAAAATPCPPVQELREAHIELVGTAAQDPRVRRSLQADVRLRNDRVVGRCST